MLLLLTVEAPAIAIAIAIVAAAFLIARWWYRHVVSRGTTMIRQAEIQGRWVFSGVVVTAVAGIFLVSFVIIK